MGKLKKYITPYVWYMLFTMVIKFAATLLELQIPDLMETMVDKKVPAGDVRQIYLYGVLMGLCALGALLGNILANKPGPPQVKITGNRSAAPGLLLTWCRLMCYPVYGATRPR